MFKTRPRTPGVFKPSVAEDLDPARIGPSGLNLLAITDPAVQIRYSGYGHLLFQGTPILQLKFFICYNNTSSIEW